MATKPANQTLNLTPMLDARNYAYLRGKKDSVKDLECIQVTFYRTGLTDVSYGMVNSKGTIEFLGVTQFHSQVAKAAKEKEKEWGDSTDVARGAIKKYYNRGLVVLPGDLTNGGWQALAPHPHPGALKSILGKSQADFNSAKLTVASVLLAHWNKVPQETKDAMDRFQEAVNPGSEPWSKRLARLTSEETDRVARKHARALASRAEVPGEEINETVDEILGMKAKTGVKDSTSIGSNAAAGKDESKPEAAEESE